MAESAAAASTPAPVTRPVGPRAPRALKPNEILIAWGVALVVLQGVFLFLAQTYYFDKVEGQFLVRDDLIDPAAAASALAWDLAVNAYLDGFLLFSVVGCGAIAAAMLKPREVGHAIVAVFGGIYLVTAVLVVARTHMPITVAVFQALIGGLLLRLGWASWKQRDRAAWAFLISLTAVLTVLMTFGAPNYQEAIGIPRVWYALAIPAVLGASLVGLYRARAQYE